MLNTSSEPKKYLNPHLIIVDANVRVLAEARFGADSQEPLVRYHIFVPNADFKRRTMDCNI